MMYQYGGRCPCHTQIQGRGYSCHWKTIDASITQHNRILIGLPRKAGASGARSDHTREDISVLKQRYHNLHGKPQP
jgi:hypothetical protein